jgi:integrase
VATKHAKTLDDAQFARLMVHCAKGQHPLRDQVMVLLSHKAGLRSCEIAGLEWTDVTTADGEVNSRTLFIPDDIAKNGKERTLPMHPSLHLALSLLRGAYPDDKRIIFAVNPQLPFRDPVRPVTANAVTFWFKHLYERCGFEGCSSHSGRRTFITRAAQRAGRFDCSLRDVQALAGHASLNTTEMYIDLSARAGELVNAL